MQRLLLCAARIAIAAMMAVPLAPLAVLARGGGKAEPLRIEFKRGAYGTAINDTVRGDEEAEYVLGAKQGQRLTVKLTAVPDKSCVFELFGEDHDTTGLPRDARFTYSAVLPKTGDYFITVKRSAQTKGTSRYRLEVTAR